MRYLKSCFPIVITYFCFQFSPFGSYAQKDTTKRDTIKKEYYEENQARADYYKRKEKYDYVTRAKIEELSMFKIGLTATPLQFSKDRLGLIWLSIGYEKKIRPDFSILGNLNAMLIPFYKDEAIFNLNLSGRYYYNMEEKIWEGKSANNLSANYVSALIPLYGVIYTGGFNPGIYPLVEALYGIQRRLGHLCYVDGNIGVGLSLNQPEIVLNLDFGLGL